MPPFQNDRQTKRERERQQLFLVKMETFPITLLIRRVARTN